MYGSATPHPARHTAHACWSLLRNEQYAQPPYLVMPHCVKRLFFEDVDGRCDQVPLDLYAAIVLQGSEITGVIWETGSI